MIEHINWAAQLLMTLLAAVGAFGATWAATMKARAEAKQIEVETRRMLRGIQNQVSNDHPTNLRDDITAIQTTLKHLAEAHADTAGEVREIKESMRDVKQQQQVLSADMREERRRVTRTIESAESTHADLRETQAEMSGRLRAVEAWWHQFGRRKQP